MSVQTWTWAAAFWLQSSKEHHELPLRPLGAERVGVRWGNWSRARGAAVRPPKAVLLKDRVGLGREVAIGEKQQLNALPHLFLAPEHRLAGDCGGGWGGWRFYVSHVDLSAQPSVQSEGVVRHKVPRRKPILKLGRRSNLWAGFVYAADRSVYYQDSHHEKQPWQLSLLRPNRTQRRRRRSGAPPFCRIPALAASSPTTWSRSATAKARAGTMPRSQRASQSRWIRPPRCCTTASRSSKA